VRVRVNQLASPEGKVLSYIACLETDPGELTAHGADEVEALQKLLVQVADAIVVITYHRGRALMAKREGI
jgi:hypothetical protein